ncbi:MAG: hypothetical protein J6U92_01935 [Clostridia bacterium]|nr:hypothetical protein [Clostridia bacterium]
MDKFGIFNLINSFLNFSNANQTETNSATTLEKQPSSNNILSTLTELINKNSGANGTSQTPPTSTPKSQKETLKAPLPLQSQMLSTMNSHDDFIKRVKEKNARK